MIIDYFFEILHSFDFAPLDKLPSTGSGQAGQAGQVLMNDNWGN
jgi:hypothetical protein